MDSVLSLESEIRNTQANKELEMFSIYCLLESKHNLSVDFIWAKWGKQLNIICVPDAIQ